MIKPGKILPPVAALGAGVLLGLWLFGGGGDGGSEISLTSNPLFQGSEGLGFAAQQSTGQRIIVTDGQSIQAAVNSASPGDVIQVYPGTYRETVYIDKDSITLTGVVVEGEWPTLDGGGTLNDAFLYSGDNITIENFRITHYKGNGVMGQAGNNFVIRGNVIIDAGIYGIFPQFGRNGLVAHNLLTGIADAAIYIGMSDNVDVLHNEVHGNVAGIEIENSRHVLVEGNIAYDNTGGILVFITPGLPIKTTYDVIVRGNFVFENNHENFGAPGSIVANIPPGTGIMVMAGDDVVIENNIIRDNDNVGILITSLDILKQVSNDPDSEPNSDNVAILDNLMLNNGANPVGALKALMLANLQTRGPDILDTGGGTGKCILNAGRYRTLLMAEYANCDEAAKTTRSIRSMTLDQPVTGSVYAEDAMRENIGMRSWYAICSACHAYDIQLIGPSVQDIQAIYADDPGALADYIFSPIKVRDDAPEMPPQDYLTIETRRAVADFALAMEN
ncbi:MAG: right-handed parallel beta-helix repeat-containing protein [Proteobacteria bacterium]|nr:right-handed parallel beta-helix repeat-containing protein [Pseudomonadota bacterium]